MESYVLSRKVGDSLRQETGGGMKEQSVTVLEQAEAEITHRKGSRRSSCSQAPRGVSGRTGCGL